MTSVGNNFSHPKLVVNNYFSSTAAQNSRTFKHLSRQLRVALPWELLYANDLVVIAEKEDDVIRRLNEWKDNVENRGMRVNMNKTKVMISGERHKQVQKAVRWPCRGVYRVSTPSIVFSAVILIARM